VLFLFNMSSKFIIFNSLKKAEHYVKWCKENIDYYNDGYDWSNVSTYINDDKVLRRLSGDSCGCGCDNHLYDYIIVVGRIKDKRIHSLKLILND